MNPSTPPTSPYKGLAPFSEEDALFFFGRERERRLLTANLLASSLTLVYGPSGVGKSSLLSAGVVHRLREESSRNFLETGSPEFTCIVFNTWRDTPSIQIARALYNTLPEPCHNLITPPDSERFPLIRIVKACTDQLNLDVLLILDQFEEYFLYQTLHGSEETFPEELPELVSRANPKCKVLISIREDCLARLDYFQGSIQDLFKNYLRLDALDLDSAREAVVNPIETYNQHFGTRFSLEDHLVDAILEEVRIGGTGLTQLGAFSPEFQPTHPMIEAPYLQLVMAQLWVDELRSGSLVLRLSTFQRMGGLAKVAQRHLDEQMQELNSTQRATAFRIFNFLVTPSGTKIAHTAHDLAVYSDCSEEQTREVLELLSGGGARILRAVPPLTVRSGEVRYEIFHDVLAHSIQEWRLLRLTKERDQNRQELSKKESVLDKWRVMAYALALILIGLGFRNPMRTTFTRIMGNNTGWLSVAESLNPRMMFSRRTVIVTIGDKEFWQGELAGRTPINRSYLAKLIRALDAGNPTVIALDCDLSIPSLLKTQYSYAAEDVDLLKAISDISRSRIIVLPMTIDSRDRGYIPERTIFTETGARSSTIHAGYTNIPFNIQQIPTRIQLQNGQRLDSLSTAVVRATDYYLPPKDDVPTAIEGFIAPRNFKTVSASEVLENASSEKARELLGHGVVIIGVVYHTDGSPHRPVIDTYKTPVGPMPGVFVHANYIEAMLSARTSSQLSETILLVFFELPFGICMAFIYTAVARRRKIAYIVGFYGIISVISFSLPQVTNLSVDLALPTLLLLCSLCIDWLSEIRQEARTLKQLLSGKRGKQVRAE